LRIFNLSPRSSHQAPGAGESARIRQSISSAGLDQSTRVSERSTLDRGERAQHETGPEFGKLVVQYAKSFSPDRRSFRHHDRSSVETGFHAHHHDAGFRISRHDSALDRRRAPPARQERGMEIEASESRRVEDRTRQQQAVGNDHRRVEPELCKFQQLGLALQG
jgi:hypothetical protein